MNGQQLKEHGQNVVLSHAAEWKDAAIKVIGDIAQDLRRFTAEDLCRNIPAPPHRNAIGAAFSHAAKLGIIRRVGYRAAQHKEAHGRIIAVWARG